MRYLISTFYEVMLSGVPKIKGVAVEAIFVVPSP